MGNQADQTPGAQTAWLEKSFLFEFAEAPSVPLSLNMNRYLYIRATESGHSWPADFK
jgi:hypothetical protein